MRSDRRVDADRPRLRAVLGAEKRFHTAWTHSGHRQRLTVQAALSALKRFLDGEFGIQHGIGTCKRDASPRFGCIEKDDPFPATWICHLNDFKLDGFVFHGRSLKRRHRKSSDYLATSVDCTSSRSASTFATTAAVAVTTAKVTIAKASPMSFKPSVSAI
jgi:hypothetical protein